ncbi:MAG: hypothetical protein NEA02_18800 [Thermoanaerobaculia bacterium]|nr:hypothetical protein [Thermoanaerobaculia bacterium]
MSETPPPAPAPVLPPQLPVTLPFEDAAQRDRRQGCLKWGLVGCAGASVAVIVGLLFLMNNAKKLMDFAFDQMGDQIVAASAPDVTPAEKESFRSAMKAFSEKVKNRTVAAEQVTVFQGRVRAAVADSRVTAEELRSLTAFLKDPPR